MSGEDHAWFLLDIHSDTTLRVSFYGLMSVIPLRHSDSDTYVTAFVSVFTCHSLRLYSSCSLSLLPQSFCSW
jgi:hypothetical protein